MVDNPRQSVHKRFIHAEDLSNEEQRDLKRFDDDLNELWNKASDEKKKLTTINPKFEKFSKDLAVKVEVAKLQSAAKNLPFDDTRKLQEELAGIEQQTLERAAKINKLESKALAHRPGKILDDTVDQRFNDLRRKVNLIIALIADVYAEDPACPAC